jgi:F0F1-type ATP synthase alpha subunit
MKKLAGSLKLELAQYREVEQFSKLGSELDAQTLKMLQKGQLLTEILKQKRNQPLSLGHQIFNLYLVSRLFPKVKNMNGLLEIYNRFLHLFVQFAPQFMPYTYVLGLVDKKKQNQVVVDLNFLAQIF